MTKVYRIQPEARFCMSRAEAAEYINVSPNTFDLMVSKGFMPPPRAVWGDRRVWIRAEVERAVWELPDVLQKSRSDDTSGALPSVWDDLKV
jgi:hypothetical protein